MTKQNEKEHAIQLRRRGLSYREILAKVPVAKSTLSEWLQSVSLAKHQKQRLTEKKLAGMRRGWEKVHSMCIQRSEAIKKAASAQIPVISKKELWLLGIALYWAEGAKEKPYRTGSLVQFINSDPDMLCTFKRWLIECCNIPKEDIVYDIYIHGGAVHNDAEIQKYWRSILAIPLSKSIPIYYKQQNPHPNRYNIGKEYYGILRVKVRKSTNFNRKISGWIEGIQQYCGFLREETEVKS